MKILGLTVEGERDALGMDCERPRLGWQLVSERRGAAQTAYQVQIAHDTDALLGGTELLVDTGEVASSQSQWLTVPLERLDSRGPICLACPRAR